MFKRNPSPVKPKPQPEPQPVSVGKFIHYNTYLFFMIRLHIWYYLVTGKRRIFAGA